MWNENRKFVPAFESCSREIASEVSLTSLRETCDIYTQMLSAVVPRPACHAASADCLLSTIISTWRALSHAECADRSASSYPSSDDSKELFYMWDMFSSWAVISPLRIVHAARPHVAIWKTVIRPTLLHLESCRLVFQTKHQESAPSSSHGPPTLRMSDVLSQRALKFLTADWTDMIPVEEEGLRVFPNQLLSGATGDALYDAIHADLIMHGIWPSGSASKYWTSYLLSQCMSGSALTQIALIQVVTNCSHMLEYSTWPVAYTCSLIETAVSTATKKEASPSLASAMIAMRQQAVEEMCRVSGVDKRLLLQLAGANCVP